MNIRAMMQTKIKGMRVIVVLLYLLGLVLSLPFANAESIKIGVLAFRPKPQTLSQWQPLAVALKQAMPEREFIIEPLTYQELDVAVANHQIDFMFTNPGHYVLLSNRYGLSSPLATMVNDVQGHATKVFGGVIFCQAKSKLNSLEDLRGKSIATVSTKSLGGYQMQVYELNRIGIDPAKDSKLIITGMPHDNIVDAVLSGRADAGFVRSGILDTMQREGKLDMSMIKLLNPQNYPEFPVPVSTRLYPEWPFTVLPHVDDHLARHVVSVLFQLEKDATLTKSMQISGFTIPADYTPVEDLLRQLRLPPFEASPTFTFRDVFSKFEWQILGALLFLGLILLLGFALLLMYRKLATTNLTLRAQRQQLMESEAFKLSILDSMTAEVAVLDCNGVIIAVNEPWQRFSFDNAIKPEVTLAHTGVGANYLDMCLTAVVTASGKDILNAREGIQAVINGKLPSFSLEYPCDSPTQKRWFNMIVTPMGSGELGVVISHTNITERKMAENNLRIAATAFESQQGMVITDANGTIIRVNHAFTDITGYTAEEAVGNNMRFLKSTRHDADFYALMWTQISETGTWEGEVWNRRKNGDIYPEQLTITSVKDQDGKIINYVGAFADISIRKASEARIGFLANHDRLTELPNRELFYDRLSQAISQARRRNEGLAILFLDLDGFKPINDSYGHEAGDVVLKIVAKRLQACVRNVDTVARMGGDEFAIILSEIKDSMDAIKVAEKVIHHLAETMILNEVSACNIGVSIGIAIYPDNGTELDTLMREADGAMYASKAAGKNTYTLSKLQEDELTLNAPWITLDAIQLVGIQVIDDQHQAIAGLINGLNDALKYAEPTEQVIQRLDELIRFTDHHFKTEEQLMREYGYPDELAHKNAHDHLLNEVTYLKERFIQGGELVLLQRLKDWLVLHITSSDISLADFIMQYGGNCTFYSDMSNKSSLQIIGVNAADATVDL